MGYQRELNSGQSIYFGATHKNWNLKPDKTCRENGIKYFIRKSYHLEE